MNVPTAQNAGKPSLSFNHHFFVTKQSMPLRLISLDCLNDSRRFSVSAANQYSLIWDPESNLRFIP